MLEEMYLGFKTFKEDLNPNYKLFSIKYITMSFKRNLTTPNLIMNSLVKTYAIYLAYSAKLG